MDDERCSGLGAPGAPGAPGALDTRGFCYRMPVRGPDRARLVEVCRRDVVAFLHGQGVPAEDLLDLELILGEAAGNVAKHSLSPVMRVTVSAAVSREAGVAVLMVEDDGVGFDPSSVPEPDIAAESGRGLFLMRRLAETTVISRPGFTHVTAKKRWST